MIGPALPLGSAQIPAEALEKSRQAGDLVQAGNPGAAIPVYQELVAKFPSETAFRVNLIVAEFKAGRYRETVDLCNALVKMSPDLFPAWLFLGASHLKLGENAEAATSLRKAVAIQPADVNARLMLGDALLAQEAYSDAVEQYLQASKSMPDSPRVWVGLFNSYRGLTAAELGRLAQVAPGSVELFALSGELELDRDQLAPAYRHYRQALKAAPGFRGLHTAIAGIYQLSGHPEWAQAERALEVHSPLDCTSEPLACSFGSGKLSEVAAAEPRTPNALYWRARALHALSRQAFTRLQELPPSRERYEAVALAHERSGRYREAAVAWSDALQFAPNDTGIERRMALALCQSNDCYSALPLIENLLKQQPSSAEMNYLYGLALAETRDFARAIPHLEKAVDLDRSFLPARAVLGEAYLETGDPNRAIPSLEAACAEDSDGRRHYQLARAYQATGRKEQAIPVLQEYRRILERREAADRDEPRITPPGAIAPAR
jgi:tetratricopeptide (TPR) repeat protein